MTRLYVQPRYSLTSSSKFLLEDIENLGSVRASQVQGARNDVLRIARQLAASGEIELSFNDDEEMIE